MRQIMRAACAAIAWVIGIEACSALPVLAYPAVGTVAKAPARVTILYDAFGDTPGLTRDWGFAALIEYGGKRILFDTGNNADVFAHNVSALGVDLWRLDFVVISHRHGDHIAGLPYLLQVNPTVKIYAPKENFGSLARPSRGRSSVAIRRCPRGCGTLPASRRTSSSSARYGRGRTSS
ncbi:MAG TPA: MBL fold metallo-hydrolase [Gemmatimonadaceae bacterium]|nr:MBL fold metallo-hydrolase [Gemmatimonadaceae bacterium]